MSQGAPNASVDDFCQGRALYSSLCGCYVLCYLAWGRWLAHVIALPPARSQKKGAALCKDHVQASRSSLVAVALLVARGIGSCAARRTGTICRFPLSGLPAPAQLRLSCVRSAGGTDPDYPVLNIHVAERLPLPVACLPALQVTARAFLQPRTVSSWSE